MSHVYIPNCGHCGSTPVPGTIVYYDSRNATAYCGKAECQKALTRELEGSREQPSVLKILCSIAGCGRKASHTCAYEFEEYDLDFHLVTARCGKPLCDAHRGSCHPITS